MEPCPFPSVPFVVFPHPSPFLCPFPPFLCVLSLANPTGCLQLSYFTYANDNDNRVITYCHSIFSFNYLCHKLRSSITQAFLRRINSKCKTYAQNVSSKCIKIWVSFITLFLAVFSKRKAASRLERETKGNMCPTSLSTPHICINPNNTTVG